MKVKYFLLALVLGIELFTTKFWFACRDFSDSFHFSSLDMRLKLEEATHNDVGFSTNAARFFHNKAVFSINQIFINYFRFWDIRFGAMFFSIIGYCGIFLGFWYLIKIKSKYKWLILAALLLIPFSEVFRSPMPYQFRLVSLSLPYQVLSVFGFWQFIKIHKKWAVLFLLILAILSIWYLAVFKNDIFFSCLKK